MVPALDAKDAKDGKVDAETRFGSGKAAPHQDETLGWLLDPANPSARYLTLTRVLDRPEDDPDVLSSRVAIPQSGPARAILRAQYPQGYWMHPGIGYSPRYRATVWQLLFLAQLGIERTEAIDRAVEHLFEANQREDGAFRASTELDDTPVCLNGSLLWALERLGYGDAPQVARAWTWLADDVRRRGFICTVPDRKVCGHDDRAECRWGTVKVLWAANAVLAERRNSAVVELRGAVAERLLADPPHAGRDSPLWFRLTFPLAHTADLVQWLSVLVDAGCGDDPRLPHAYQWLETRQLPDGAWPLERIPGKMWADFGDVGEPNKWVTIRVLALERQQLPRL